MAVDAVSKGEQTESELASDNRRNDAYTAIEMWVRRSAHTGGGFGVVKRRKYAAALTLVEIMAAILVLIVAVLGASGYRYYAGLDARRAGLYRSAATVALLLCESWRGVEGSETYDPTAHLGSDLNITTVSGTLNPPSDFEALGGYKIIINGVSYWALLSWQDISPTLRALNVVIAWEQTGRGGTFEQSNRRFRLTTYALREKY